jgi:hypothetical protein
VLSQSLHHCFPRWDYHPLLLHRKCPLRSYCFVDDGEDGEENNTIEEDIYDEEVEGDNPTEGNNGEETEITHTTPGDGTVVVRELCEGFPNNRTLQTIEMQRCRLTDSQIALIFDSLAHHPTITHINLSENSCRTMGLEALDRILVSPFSTPQSATNKTNQSSVHHCRIESLDLSYQFTSEETYGTGEHIQLDILTRNCTTKGADKRVYPNLRKLVLQGNQIDDSDMQELSFLIRHRFPRLEELDLRFNEITTDGLEAFVQSSDPNNDNFVPFIDDTKSYSNDYYDSNHQKKFKDHFPPPSSRLRTIRLTNNPLVMTNETSIVILKLLKIYPELQLIQSNLEWEDGSSISQYIQHLLDINRAGRILLLAGSSGISYNSDKDMDNLTRFSGCSTSSNVHGKSHEEHTSFSPKSNASIPDEEQRLQQLMHQRRRPIPLAAWPLVLARLTRKARFPHYIPKKNSLNGMYYLIRHGPIIMEQIASRTTKTTPKKKNEDNENQEQERKRKWGDPALGGYETLADFLQCELGVNS